MNPGGDRNVDLGEIAQGFMGLGVLYGLAIFAAQVFFWLKSGTWTPAPLLALFVDIGDAGRSGPLALVPTGTFQWPWLEQPDSWMGLHRLISGTLFHIPLSIFVPVACIALTLGSFALVTALKPARATASQ